MSDDIDEMKHAQKLALKARTTLGRILWVFGIVFSIILVVRVILAASSILRVPNESISPRRRDPITMIILWLTGHHIVSDEQYNIYLQGTSLILAGLLTISQVRNFFRVIGALGRKLSQMTGFAVDTKSDRIMGELSLLMSSFVMGCYFLSCVVVMKVTLPLEYRSSFSAAVGNLNDFGFNSTVLNMIFCMVRVLVQIILYSVSDIGVFYSILTHWLFHLLLCCSRLAQVQSFWESYLGFKERIQSDTVLNPR